MQTSTLLDYLTTADIVVFLGVPLGLLTLVLAQQLFAARRTASIGRSSSRRPAQPSITQDPAVRSKPIPGGTVPRK
jgi:hypothetical protein